MASGGVLSNWRSFQNDLEVQIGCHFICDYAGHLKAYLRYFAVLLEKMGDDHDSN